MFISWQWISSRNDLLYIGENLGCIMFRWLKVCYYPKNSQVSTHENFCANWKFQTINIQEKLFDKIKVGTIHLSHSFRCFKDLALYNASSFLLWHFGFCNFFVPLLQFKYSIDLLISIYKYLLWNFSYECISEEFSFLVAVDCAIFYLSKFTIKELHLPTVA